MFQSCVLFFRRYCLKNSKFKEEHAFNPALEISDLQSNDAPIHQKIERNEKVTHATEKTLALADKKILLSTNQRTSPRKQEIASDHDWVLVNFNAK